MLTKNSEKSLFDSLSSAKKFQQVLLLDTGSVDTTFVIAKKFSNVVVIETPFTNFGALRNQAANLALYDWIFALDSDEILSPQLVDEIFSMDLDPRCVYEIKRDNFYREKQIRGCGWDQDFVIRLYHRSVTCFSNHAVHERVLSKNTTVIRLKHSIKHTPYRTISDLLTKMQLYSDLFAKDYQGIRKASLKKALWHGWGAFLKSYILKRGVFLGSEGFLISSYNGITAFYKYLKLAESNATKLSSR